MGTPLNPTDWDTPQHTDTAAALDSLDFTRQAVILGGGCIHDFHSVAAKIAVDAVILCADSGYDHCLQMGLRPHLLVGDFDSVRHRPPASIPRIPFPAEKNYTDLTHAMEIAIEKNCRHILMAGVLGGRIDHELGNLQNMVRLAQLGIRNQATDGVTDLFAIHNTSLHLARMDNSYFSVLSLSEVSTGVFIKNAAYPLDNYTLTYDRPRGISNEFIGRDATISVSNGTLLVTRTPKDAPQA